MTLLYSTLLSIMYAVVLQPVIVPTVHNRPHVYCIGVGLRLFSNFGVECHDGSDSTLDPPVLHTFLVAKSMKSQTDHPMIPLPTLRCAGGVGKARLSRISMRPSRGEGK